MKTEHTIDQQQATSNSEQLAVLKRHFPQCFDKHGQFVLSRFQDILQAHHVEASQETYKLDWLGKSYAHVLRNESIRTLLSADTAHNHKTANQNSQNILIQGDNLEVLKHLKGAYSEAVKMIYIDPPYNTGSDGFVYEDDRKFTPEQLANLANVDVEEAQRILNFTQSKANSHSAWLTFMYPRLYVARALLRDDGVIFISIDDNEQAQLKLLCDEVFGEGNFVGQIIWKNATDNNPSNIATEHEYILVYAQNKQILEPVWKSQLSVIKEILIKIGKEILSATTNLEEAQEKYKNWYRVYKSQLGVLDRYKYIDKGGVYTGSQSVHNPNKEGYRYDVLHNVTGKPCKEPLNGYRFPEKTMQKLLSENKILFGEDENKIIELKVYAHEFEEKLSSVIELDGRLGSYSIKELLSDSKLFTNSKPVDLLEKIISYVTTKTDIVLDFFAGSGTTTHAVMQLNAEDDGKRQFICVQLDEKTDPKKEAYKAGYHSIFDITKARTEKAAQKIKTKKPDYDGDLGFKIFKTVPLFVNYQTPMQQLDANLPLFDGTQLANQDLENLLITWQVMDRIPLHHTLQPLDLAGYRAHWFDNTVYLMQQGFESKNLKALIEKLDEDKTFTVTKLIMFGYNLTSRMQREIDEGLKNYRNKKSIVLDVVVRY